MSSNGTRTRIAPSPTGPLHIGTARTALFNFLYSAQNKGVFILRIEDTDLERSDSVFERDIKESLHWLGLNWDEFYRQSERLDLYEKHLKKLLEKQLIFWCPHSSEDLAEERREQFLKKEPPRHICSFRGKGLKEKDGEILRFKNDFSGNVDFNDLVRGKVSFNAELLGDFSVAKNLQTPLYNFAVVVDDFETKISHVIRGEDHISNTPKQILLFRALGFEIPNYAHIPLILGTDRTKLSKRDRAVSVLEYKKSGYLSEAMVNFLVLLSWRPDFSKENTDKKEKEIFSKEEMIEEFSIGRVQKGGAIFDINKLKWLNAEYIKKLKTEDLAERLKEFVPDLSENINSDPEKWIKVAGLLRERLTTLNEAGELSEYFYKYVYYARELLFWKENQKVEDILRHLKRILEILLKMSKWSSKELNSALMPYAEKEGRGVVLWPFRVALSGRRASAGPFEIADILGKEETVERMEKAIKMLE